jgi:hypothetical protein
MKPEALFVSPSRTANKVSRRGVSLRLHRALAAAKLTSGTLLSSALRNAGDSAVALQIQQTRDRGQSNLDVFVVEHGLEFEQPELCRAGKTERFNGMGPGLRILVFNEFSRRSRARSWVDLAL